MSALATRFGRNVQQTTQQNPLTDDQMFNIAPSVFATEKYDTCSARYTYIPTIDVLNGLRREGFQPFMVAQSKSRIEGKSEFTKHMIRLRHESQITAGEANEIILINSHDKTSSYQMLAGCFRFVCCNGMVSGDIVEDVRVPHRGQITDGVIEAAYRIMDDFEPVTASIERMKSIDLTPREQVLLAEVSLQAKYEDPSKESPIVPFQLLDSRRYGDNGNDIWGTFNRIQENMLRGGVSGRTASGKRTTTRPVGSIDNNVKLNRALWILADQMAAIKA